MLKRALGSLVVTAVFSVVLASVGFAQSGRVTIRTVEGGTIIGEVVEDIPGDYLTVILATGEARTIPYDRISEILPTGAQQAPTAPAPAPVAPAVARPGATPLSSSTDGNYELRRAALLDERPSLAPPIVFMGIGAGLLITGGAVYAAGVGGCGYYDSYWDDYSYSSCDPIDNPAMIAGIALMSAGSVMTVIGISILPGRIVARARNSRQLDELDAEYGRARLDVSPLLGHASVRDARGLQLRLAF